MPHASKLSLPPVRSSTCSRVLMLRLPRDGMASCLRLLTFVASVIYVNAECLSTFVPASARLNVTIEGVSMPIGLPTVNWDSARINREIMIIVFREILGYNAEITRTIGGSDKAFLAVAGCQDIDALSMEDRKCSLPGVPFEDHVTMEVWSATADAMVTLLSSCCPAIAPKQAGVLSYRGTENEFVFPHSYTPAMEDSLSLTYYKTWNASWLSDPSPYFSLLSDFDDSEILNCDSNSALASEELINDFVMATGWQSAIVDNKFACYNNKWVLGPGCRVTGFNADHCAPYLTAYGWQFGSTIQKIFAFNTAIAYGEASSWTNYVNLPRNKRVASYWWSPAQEFADIGPSVITWSPSNKAAWDARIRTGQNPGSQIKTFVSSAIAERYDSVYKTASNFDLILADVEFVMANLKSKLEHGVAEPYVDTACEWVQANLAKVQSWIPSPVECSPGTGVRTADGGYDPAGLEDAAYCEWCPPGRFSSAARLGSVQTFKCESCPAGQKMAVGGSTECESCGVGSFSGSPGQTDCKLCPIGTYMGQRGASQCDRCPSPMVTVQEGSLVETECLCPENYVRPCLLRSAPNGTRGGCNCDPSVYHPPTNAYCIPCPSPDFLQCGMGTDEVDLPCSSSMENVSLNYPRPKPGYYTSFEKPLQVYKCKDSIICPGNAVGLCAPNAHGIACGLCEDGYYRSVDGYCVECGGVFKMPFVPVASIVLVPIGLMIMIKLGGNNDVTKGQLSPFNELLGLSYVGIIFMQTLGTNIGIMPSAPTMIADSFSWTPAISDIASQFRLSCFAPMSFEVEFTLKLLAPIYGAFLFGGVYLVAACIPRLRLNKDVVVGTYLSVFNAFFISVMNLSLTLFQTYRNPTGEWSMISAPSVLTSSDVWQSLVYATAVAVVIYGVGAAAGSAYAIVVAPSKFKDVSFRMRWKCLFLQVRPSVYWWVIVSILKGLFLSLTTVIFDSPMAQTVYLGTGLLIYFLAVFWFLPWRTSTLLCLDVALHYVLAVLCLLMPFFVPASATEIQDVSVLFLVVSVFGAFFAAGCVLGVMRTQSPNAQRAWRLTYERDARKFVHIFEVPPAWQTVVMQ
ncbi:unnamed protein product [Symbiodinium sp. CCMP2592]|nr:unnamed protein product [Symbiodinium sp. CCMP2592]